MSGYLALIGAGLDIYGKKIAADQQEYAYKEDAKTAIANANTAIKTAQATADQHAIQSQMMIAGGEAEYAAGGLEGGSVDAVMANSRANAEMDRLNILFGGNIKSKNFMTESQRAQHSADAMDKAGILGELSGGFSAASNYSKNNSSSFGGTE